MFLSILVSVVQYFNNRDRPFGEFLDVLTLFKSLILATNITKLEPQRNLDHLEESINLYTLNRISIPFVKEVSLVLNRGVLRDIELSKEIMMPAHLIKTKQARSYFVLCINHCTCIH